MVPHSFELQRTQETELLYVKEKERLGAQGATPTPISFASWLIPLQRAPRAFCPVRCPPLRKRKTPSPKQRLLPQRKLPPHSRAAQAVPVPVLQAEQAA